MAEPIQFRSRSRQADERDQEPGAALQRPASGVPSNEVYARVGDAVLTTAQEGVRGGLPPQDIIRDILARHGVRLSLGELRLLLASRRI